MGGLRCGRANTEESIHMMSDVPDPEDGKAVIVQLAKALAALAGRLAQLDVELAVRLLDGVRKEIEAAMPQTLPEHGDQRLVQLAFDAAENVIRHVRNNTN